MDKYDESLPVSPADLDALAADAGGLTADLDGLMADADNLTADAECPATNADAPVAPVECLAALVLVVCRSEAEPLVAQMGWPSFAEERLYALLLASHARRQVVSSCARRGSRW